MEELVSKVNNTLNQKSEYYKIFKTKNEKPTDESVCIVKKYCSILNKTVKTLKNNKDDKNDSILFKKSISSLNTMNNKNKRCLKCKSWIEEKCIYCSKNDQEIVLINEISKDKIKENIMEHKDSEDIVIKTPKFYDKKFKVISNKNQSLTKNLLKIDSSCSSHENPYSKLNLCDKIVPFFNKKNEIKEIKLEIDKFFIGCNRFTKSYFVIQNDGFLLFINNFKIVINYSGVKEWNYQITSTYLYLWIKVNNEIIKSIFKLIKNNLEFNFSLDFFDRHLFIRAYKKEEDYVNFFKKILCKFKIKIEESKLEMYFKKYNDNFINNIEKNTNKRIKLEENKLAEETMSLLESESSDVEFDEIIDAKQSPKHKISTNKILFKVSKEETMIISKNDLKSLGNEIFLNDKIIEFYLLFIKARLINNEIAKKTYIFNTFFFSKLISSVLNTFGSNKTLFENQYNQIKSWTKNVDIFDYDFLIIPIFKDHHWSLAIVCYHAKILDEEIIDDDEDNQGETLVYKKPCIIFMDSLGNKFETTSRFSQYLRNFLEKECLNKKKLQKKFSELFMPTLNSIVPMQTNGYDCGIFILHYVELFLKNPSVVFSSLQMKKLNLQNWFNSNSILNKRKQIYNILYNIHLSNLKEGISCETDDESTFKSDEEIEIIKNSSINDSKRDFLACFLSEDED